MPKPDFITLREDLVLPILHEDHAVLAIDKPAGWLVAPEAWTHTARNLQLALRAALAAGDPWVRSRRLKFLRFVHRLDADTSGVLLLVKHPGALRAYSELFARRHVEKIYLAVVQGRPRHPHWRCQLALAPSRHDPTRIRVDAAHGQPAETAFRVLCPGPSRTLVEARPLTGRTHQIRVHLAAAGCPVLGDPWYGQAPPPTTADPTTPGLALRAVGLAYRDPFRRRPVRIRAPWTAFLAPHGFPPNLDYVPTFEKV